MVRLALCFLLLSGGVGAATYQAVLDQTTYSSMFGASDVRFTPSSLPGFTADFAADKLLTVTWSAPTGFHFSFPTPPVDANLIFVFGMDGLGINFPPLPGSIVFDGATGTLPAMTANFQYYGNGMFSASASGHIGGAFTFSSMTFSSPVPAGYNTSFNQATPSNASIRGLTTPIFGPDPGQWAFLEADAATVLEPASGGLVLGALGVLTVLGRKSHN